MSNGLSTVFVVQFKRMISWNHCT